MTKTTGYRADLDGMRAIAVLLVIFYHAGFDVVPGGFIGVDIFFVLSGYLITGIVAREVANGSFSFPRFYTRRIKRLLPAYFTVLVAVFAVSFAILLPTEFEALSTSALASLVFASNVYFGATTEGYFAPEVGSLPLLHTWSLAVEEQFYFVWPISLLVLSRRVARSWLIPLLSALAIISFAAAEISVRQLSDTVYYALWSRAGELMIGAILALHHLSQSSEDPGRIPTRTVEGLGTLGGFALVLLPAFLLDDTSRFPGLNAFWPCVGTAILIHVGRRPGALSHRLLHSPPLVWTGLLSYALYLWHWPIFVFARALRIEATVVSASAQIMLAFVLSYLSWRFIEDPIRRRSDLDFRGACVRIMTLPALVLATAFGWVWVSQGLPMRFPEPIVQTIRLTEAGPDADRRICHHLDEIELPPAAECQLGAREDDHEAHRGRGSGAPVRALLWGDSIANHYAGFFDEVGRTSGIRLRDITMAGCPPLLGTVRLEYKKGALCRKRNDRVAELISSGAFHDVYIGGFWTSYLHSLGDDVDMRRSPENSERVMRAGLERTLRHIVESGKRPILLRNVPMMDFDAARCTIKNAIHLDRLRKECEMSRSIHSRRVAPIDRIFEEMATRFPELRVLDVTSLVCNDETCLAELGGIPLYKNRVHLNMAGSRALGRASLVRFGPLDWLGGADSRPVATDEAR